MRSTTAFFRTTGLSAISALVAALALAIPGHAHAADLTLDISGVTGTEGSVMVAVFPSAAEWLKKPLAAERMAVSQARDGKLSITLKGLPDVPLAASIILDRNGNGRLDMNPMGMPVEPFAFSRQAPANFGPPRFEDAVLPAGTRQHAIQLPAQ